METITTNHKLLEEYMLSMSEKEKKACEIARSHLGSLFDLEKTTGFIQWKQKKPPA